jgi:hypothetical protein
VCRKCYNSSRIIAAEAIPVVPFPSPARHFWSIGRKNQPLIVGVLIFCMWLLSGHPLDAQISPGPLSKAHQSLSGLSQCVACHKLGTSRASVQCLECHTDIASRLIAGRGLHASFLGKTWSSTGCRECHSEHNGESFALIHWTPTRSGFNHWTTGYPLEGKHAELDCQRCHTPQHISVAERSGIRMKDLSRTYLGLSTRCVSCHTDPHKGKLGENCLHCHSPALETWKISGFDRPSNVTMGQFDLFDHSKTRYPLTGGHLHIACAKCHVPIGPDRQPKFSGLPFGRCEDCHADPHKGAFSSSCQSCHSTLGWLSFAKRSLANDFDHSKTKFPLLGKHIGLSCGKCHTEGGFKKAIAFQTCFQCHNPDPHGGQFTKRADGGRCESCHTVEGFKPAKFGLVEHAATQYPLKGRHAEVRCAACHIPAGLATIYKIKFGTCLDCHRDIHEGQFAAAPNSNRCESCHSVEGFHPSMFGLARHQASRFPLTGGHIATPCADCHRPLSIGKVIPYHFSNLTCTACHQDPHKGQFMPRMVKMKPGGGTQGCEACHTTTNWQELTHFDHGTTKFPLTGSHRAVACIACHKPSNRQRKMLNADFHSAPRACEGCHQDIHGGQFAKNNITSCVECHNTTKWKPSTFDHDTRTVFPLKEAHKKVSCDLCHTSIKLIGVTRVRFYQRMPTECEACHGPEAHVRAGTFGFGNSNSVAFQRYIAVRPSPW